MSNEEPKASNACKVIKSDGSRCKATLPGSQVCVFHDPSRVTERQAAKSRGGQHNRKKTLDPGSPDIKIESSSDLLEFMNITMNQVRTGRIDSRIGSTLGYLADITMRAVKQNDLEKRIQTLEKLLEERVARLRES